MRCVDVNVLVYANRADSVDHQAYRDRLERWSNDDTEPVGLPDVVVNGFLRIVTNRRIYADPTPPPVAWRQVDEMLNAPAARLLRGSDLHWAQFRRLAEQIDAKGDDITDAYIAAYAIANNATFLSADRGFRRFDGLRYEHPLV